MKLLKLTRGSSSDVEHPSWVPAKNASWCLEGRWNSRSDCVAHARLDCCQGKQQCSRSQFHLGVVVIIRSRWKRQSQPKGMNKLGSDKILNKTIVVSGRNLTSRFLWASDGDTWIILFSRSDLGTSSSWSRTDHVLVIGCCVEVWLSDETSDINSQTHHMLKSVSVPSTWHFILR